MQLYLSAAPEYYRDASRYGLRLAHLAYRAGVGGHLLRKNLPQNLRGGLMVLTDAELPPLTTQETENLCREVLTECMARGFDGVVADFDAPPSPQRAMLSQQLAALLNKNSKRFYVTPRDGHRIGSAVALVCTSVSGGSFKYMVRDMLSVYGQKRVALDLARLIMDFPLPSQSGMGKPLSEASFAELKAQVSPSVFYSSDLCAKYFTYNSGGQTHFVLYDDAETLIEKIRIGDAFGISTGFLQYGEVRAMLPQIVGGNKK